MIRGYIIEQLQNPKVGAAVAAITIGNGVSASILDIIPDNIVKLSTLVGILVGIVVIFCHIYDQVRKARIDKLEYEKITLENKILRSKCTVMEEIDRNISNG